MVLGHDCQFIDINIHKCLNWNFLINSFFNCLETTDEFIIIIQVGFVEQQRLRHWVKKYFKPNDPLWNRQWTVVRI